MRAAAVVAWAACVLACAAAAAGAAPSTSDVQISSGTVRGVCEYGYCAYKGIPYAESTAGDKRWTDPVPVTRLPGASPFNASEFGPVCPQKQPYAEPLQTWRPMSEDCLSVNVWSPSSAAAAASCDAALLPVMAWIHGGGFMLGASADPVWCGGFLANTSHVVVVSFNYRLGALGWLNTQSLSGNYGIKDQQVALQWVNKNIAAFGGDPARVTLVGQSAGAMSIMTHLAVPSSASLFAQAVMESNLAGLLYRTPAENQPYSEKFATNLNCSVTDNACLRAAPLDSIIFYDVARAYLFPLPFSTANVLVWMPVVDGEFLPTAPLDAITSGSAAAKPAIIGFVKNETARFVPDIPFGNTIYEGIVKAVFSTNASQVLQQYPPLRRRSRQQLDDLTVDYAFLCSGRYMARAMAQRQPVYMYDFLHAPEYDPINHANRGCQDVPCHSSEIPYVFHSQTCVEGAHWSSAEEALSAKMQAYWASFIKTGSPGADWPKYTPSSNVTLMLDTERVYEDATYRNQYCEFWDAMGYIY